ncbi:MAG: hypothetical protein U9N45_07305 [Gemmatimonadota bacterium]|nr:hypothetical protein [Gemmatimonadota bacterium]
MWFRKFITTAEEIQKYIRKELNDTRRHGGRPAGYPVKGDRNADSPGENTQGAFNNRRGTDMPLSKPVPALIGEQSGVLEDIRALLENPARGQMAGVLESLKDTIARLASLEAKRRVAPETRAALSHVTMPETVPASSGHPKNFVSRGNSPFFRPQAAGTTGSIRDIVFSLLKIISGTGSSSGKPRSSAGSISFPFSSASLQAGGTENNTDSPFGGILDTSQGGTFDMVSISIKDIEERYLDMVGKIVSGNRTAQESVIRLFDELSRSGGTAATATGEHFARVQGEMFSAMGNYASQLGKLTGLASRAFFSLRSMNPFSASAAAAALQALGSALRRLASSVGTARGLSSPGGYSSGWQQGAAATSGTAGAGNTWRGPRTVNVYINGIKSSSPYEVDRALNRAGVDRELRARIRELARTGSNPLPAY